MGKKKEMVIYSGHKTERITDLNRVMIYLITSEFEFWVQI